MTTKKILVVDDDRDFAEALAVRCQSIGLEVETAQNALTALAIMGVKRPDLICLDIDMPSGNGLNIREFLSADPAASETPVVIVTGRSDEGTVRRCGELKAHYAHKSPNLWKNLRPLICALLKHTPDESAALDPTATCVS